MREILFRGKDRTGIMNHSWQVGALDNTNAEFPKIIRLDRWGNQMIIDVAPETVGQFTGLTDKNGKRIFEWDILSERPDCNKEAYIGYVEWDDKEALWRFRFPDNLEYFAALGTYSTSYKVIGNIHDNPELLEEKR